MRLSAGQRLRRVAAGASLGQLGAVLCAIAVVAAMLLVAESAQHSADTHQREQVLVERVHGQSEEIGAVIWEGVGEMFLQPAGTRRFGDSALVAHGFAAWRELDRSLHDLRATDSSPTTRALIGDAQALYASAIAAYGRADSTGLRVAVRRVRAVFGPLLARLDADATRAAAVEQAEATRASNRAGWATIGSLVIGLLLLLLIAVALHRQRRAVTLGEARRALERRSEERVRALVEHSSDVVTVVGQDLAIRWQSPSVQRTLGHTAEDLTGRKLTEIVHPADVLLIESHVATAGGKTSPGIFTARFRHASGGWRYLETIAENRMADPAVAGVVLSMRDISERKALEEELRHQAFHDALTGLANRALFEDRLTHALAGARRHGRPVAVLFLDLDDFKTINDSLGHGTGDELLRAVAIRIAGFVRVTDTAARLGGDEFAILLEILESEDDAEVIASRMLEVLKVPFEIAGRELRVNASIGLAKSDGSIGVDDLLRNADTAMYAAKEAGKGTAQAFEEGMHERVLHRLELSGEFQRGIEQEQFELDYQPIVDLETGHITGAEALVRWAHPTRGRLGPGHFIALAEETGLIVPLGDWILRTACHRAAAWHREFPDRGLDINVNVSTRQLHDAEFPHRVESALRDSGLPPRQLVLEITESLLPDDSEEILQRLHELKRLGVRVAVDDFGTGYSALSRLQAYPVDILKIDRSFVDGLENDPGKGQLVEGIVNLGETLSLQVVAEGIEEREQADQLRRMRSALGQGFLFSRPVNEQRLGELLRDGQPLAAETRAA